MIPAVTTALCDEARMANERRMLVLSGSRTAGLDAADAVIDAAPFDRSQAVIVGSRDLGITRIDPDHAADLLGTTNPIVIFDAYDGLRPNAIGRIVGTVDGGGLFGMVTPPLDTWPDLRDAFDETLAVPPFAVDAVGNRFRTRFVETIQAHPGIAVIDVDTDSIIRDGLTHPPPRSPPPDPPTPPDTLFPNTAYSACVTADQVTVLQVLETLRTPGHAIVVEADRGRGKSSVAGIAAGALAANGDDVLITAPRYRNAAEGFARADELLAVLGERAAAQAEDTNRLDARSGGCIRFLNPIDAADADPDVLFVDEAAAIPVPVLTEFLSMDRAAYLSTVHGYEGAGRGFTVRFRDRLEASSHDVIATTLTEPIRYAAGDPVEIWAFRAFLFDANPAVDQVVSNARPATVEYRALAPDELIGDERLLREVFGLLVTAHYRTAPNDLIRLLDAPNTRTHALMYDGHVVSVTVLALEGDLDADLRSNMYEGTRVRGNMLPDVLTSQLGDETAAGHRGARVMRIATHAAVRSRGLGSWLLGEINNEFADLDWLGAGYGATPELVAFWDQNGFSTVHVSTTRNDSSGEYSALMLSPQSDAGKTLHDRHAEWFANRITGVLSDALSDLDPDVVRAVLRATDADSTFELSTAQWRMIARTAFGPGLMDVDPIPFRVLAVRYFLNTAEPAGLTRREEQLLVARVLQTRQWEDVAEALNYPSTTECMRALGDAYKPLVNRWGSDPALAERERFTN